MKKEMLINVSQSEECRIALLEDGQLEELYTERTSQHNWVGNIYKGKIVNIEPSIQAAFVDFGVGRNGFLHISDVEPQYFRQGGYDPKRSRKPNEKRTKKKIVRNLFAPSLAMPKRTMTKAMIVDHAAVVVDHNEAAHAAISAVALASNHLSKKFFVVAMRSSSR